MRIFIIFLLLFSSLRSQEEKKPEPPKIGNFSLPASQQPSTLFGFGGNIIDPGEVQLFFFWDDFEGKRKTAIDFLPNIIFGVNENWSISFFFPFTPKYRDGRDRSSGLEDFYVETEYAIYNKSTYCYTDQATVLAALLVPTGSAFKNPNTGNGSPAVFLGSTFYRTYVCWIFFTNIGALFTTSENRIRFGNQYFYQFGASKNFRSPKGWIYSAMLELDGQYIQKSRIDGFFDPNSGGSSVFVTPSLWISSKEFIFQFGVSFPVEQNLFGKQNKFDYVLNLDLTWSFYQ